MRRCKAKLDFTDFLGDGTIFECQLSGRHRKHFHAGWHNSRSYELTWTDARTTREKICDAWKEVDYWWYDMIDPIVCDIRRFMRKFERKPKQTLEEYFTSLKDVIDVEDA